MSEEKLCIKINSKQYDIDAKGEFKEFLHHSILNDFNLDTNNDVKKLLNAYLKNSYKLYKMEQELLDLDQKLDEVVLFKK